jgi:spore coat polysaccharide biosynthesis protein SpsF
MKALRAVAGRPMITHVIERALAVRGVDAVAVATTNHRRDDALATVALRSGVNVVRGDEQDVLMRLTTAATLARARVVVRVTGDCPLLDPALVEQVIELQRTDEHSYAWNDTAASGWPDGTDAEVFPMGALIEAHLNATRKADREHVTPWIRENRRVLTLPAPNTWTHLKLSVDREQDLRLVQRIYEHLPRGRFALADTLEAWRKAMA